MRFYLIILLIPKTLYSLLRRCKGFLLGHHPEFLGLAVLKLLSSNPVTFQQKIMYKMAYDRTPIISLWADKIEVRQYVEDKVGSDYLIPIIGIYREAKEINLGVLPEQCVIKPNHGSGAVIILSNRARAESRLPNIHAFNVWGRYEVRKENITETQLQYILRSWLRTSYSNDPGHFPENAYKAIVPQILVEELLVLEDEIAADYRFFIFNGMCAYIEVDQSWNASPTRDMFDSSWKSIDVELKYPKALSQPVKPRELDRMIELAETLADGVDHVRVDFYLVENRIYFGEMTNYHTSGKQRFKPMPFNLTFGEDWHPELHY